MPYQRKTKAIYVVQTNYGFGDGWEDVHCELDRLKALKSLREYRCNVPTYPHRLKRKREPISPLPK